jgi:hypothetical protein
VRRAPSPTQHPAVRHVHCGMSALLGGFNRSTQRLLILLDWEVSDGGECTDVVHAKTAGRALAAMEERSMCGGQCQTARHRVVSAVFGAVWQGDPTLGTC